MTSPQPGAPGRTDSTAVASLVLGIAGIVITVLAPILGPVALVLGVKAKKRIAESGGAVEGAGIAQAGYILGVIATVIGALGILLFGICIAAISNMGY